MTAASLDAVRTREYPGPPDGVFFNAASYGLLPRSAAEAAADLVLRRTRGHGFREEELGAILERCRAAVARLLRVSASDVALAPNTSFGVNLGVACAATLPPGAVVVSQGEFPANVLPWRALEPRGFRLDVVPTGPDGLPDAAALLARLERDDARVLALSAVQFGTGWRADLEAFGRACRERDVLFFVDAIQALGAAPLHPLECGVDMLASGGQKWLCAPWGSGFAWIHPRLRDRFDPPMVSWLAMEGALDFDRPLDYALRWRDDARRFELGTLGFQDYLGLARSVEVLLEAGVEAVQGHLRAVQAPLLAWLDAAPGRRLVTPRDPERRAGIVAFRVADVEGAAAALREARVAFAVREGSLRFSPHFYNRVEEMRRVVDVLDRSQPAAGRAAEA